jgi:hypothetical protein
MDFLQIKEIAENNELEKLGRNEEGARVYREWKEDALKVYESTEDFILVNLFGAATRTTNMGKLKASMKETTEISIILRQNDFPYHFAPNVIHYCLWSNTELLEDLIERYLKTTFNNYVWFNNPAPLKSILGIFHIHIIVKEP